MYTYRVNRPKTMAAQLRQLCAILCGLMVASDYGKGQALVENKVFKDNEAFFQAVFEVGRRHKVGRRGGGEGTLGGEGGSGPPFAAGLTLLLPPPSLFSPPRSAAPSACGTRTARWCTCCRTQRRPK